MLDINGAATGRDPRSGQIYCTDCHNSDVARNVGGATTNASGPHYSKWPHLTERRYEVNTPPAAPGGTAGTVAYSTGVTGPYALCDKCHDVDGKLVNGGDTVYGKHGFHVRDRGMSCAACHSPHGVQGSDATHHAGLVDVDVKMVADGNRNPITVATNVTNVGSNRCDLTCHNVRHNNTKYTDKKP
jgi:hypothetical protein